MNADCQVVQQYEDTSRRREEVVPRDGIHNGGGRAAAAACLSSYRSMVIHEVTDGRTADGRTLAAATVHRNHPCVLVLSVFRLPSELFDNDKFMLASERASERATSDSDIGGDGGGGECK